LKLSLVFPYKKIAARKRNEEAKSEKGRRKEA
jgi:hypothetical protein